MAKQMKKGLLIVALLVLIALPVLAAPARQSDGGVHVGPYTLAADDTYTGDLVVMGPVTLEKGSTLDGDLVVFGDVSIAPDATVTGDLAVTGGTTLAGRVAGDVFVAGNLQLRETALVEGDVSVAGTLRRDEGAQVRGEITPLEEDDFSARWQASPLGRIGLTVTGHGPRHVTWLRVLWRLVRDVLLSLALVALAFVLVSVWPRQMERMEDTLGELPWATYGVGAVSLIVTVVITSLLAITICLAPFALLGYAAMGLVILVGWVVIGTWLGRHVLKSVLQHQAPSLLASALWGTGALSLFTAFAGLIMPLRVLLLLIVFPLAAGVVVLTAFGTRPADTLLHAAAPRHPEPIVPLTWPTPRPTPPPPPPPTPAEDNVINPFDEPPPTA